MEDDAICALVTRLARPHDSGGEVIERAAILAEGGHFSAVMAWIAAHGGEPEPLARPDAGSGLHGCDSRDAEPRLPLRFVLPAGALAQAKRAGECRAAADGTTHGSDHAPG